MISCLYLPTGSNVFTLTLFFPLLFFAYLSHPEPRSNKKNPFLFKSSLAFPGDTHSRELFIFVKKKKNSFGIDHTKNRGDDIFENCVMNQQQNSNVISYSFLCVVFFWHDET